MKNHVSIPNEICHARNKTKKANHLDSSNIFDKVWRADSKIFLPRQEPLQNTSGKGFTHTHLNKQLPNVTCKYAYQASQEKEIDKDKRMWSEVSHKFAIEGTA